ncbi:ImmA/IrrE family metallo-endopeptidase [Lentzea alba]|uniref:ImmA/IrrE family metallo-endopeptidase n=1 Tax=Lentzea alba TaxID=2714351 RepID=UPI0039BFFCB1
MRELRQFRLRRRARAALRGLTMPEPFSVQALCDEVARVRGRKLFLHPFTEPPVDEMPSGLWVATDVADHVFFEQQTSRFHQEHIICHEIGHMLCGHESQRAMARTSYTTAQEHEAEMVATLILELARRRTPPATETERRISDVLGLSDE